MNTVLHALLLLSVMTSPLLAAGDFVILAREPNEGAACSHTASVWRLDQQANEIVSVARLEASYWAPTQLDPSRPDLLRLQVPDTDAPRGYRVILYHINRDDWTIRKVWKGMQALSVFTYDGTIYLQTNNARGNPRVDLRFLPGATEPELLDSPFEYVCSVKSDDRNHIIYRDGIQFLYDAATGTSRRIGLGKPIVGPEAKPSLSPDGSRLAYFIPGETVANSEQPFTLHAGLPTSGRIVLLDLEHGSRQVLDTWVYKFFGSGMNSFVGPDLAFDDAGRLQFRAIPRSRVPVGGSSKPVDVQSAELSNLRFDPQTEAVEAIPPLEIADQARPEPDDGHDKAWKFLHAQGLEAERPRAWVDTAVEFDEKRSRFLLRCLGVGSDDKYFLADIDAGDLTRVPAPPALVRANAINIIYLPEP